MGEIDSKPIKEKLPKDIEDLVNDLNRLTKAIDNLLGADATCVKRIMSVLEPFCDDYQDQIESNLEYGAVRLAYDENNAARNLIHELYF